MVWMLVGYGVGTDLRQQHADLLHLLHPEQRISGGVLEQHVEKHLERRNTTNILRF